MYLFLHWAGLPEKSRICSSKIIKISKSRVPSGKRRIRVIPCGLKAKSPVPLGKSKKGFRPKGTRLFENRVDLHPFFQRDHPTLQENACFAKTYVFLHVFVRDILARGPLGKGDKRGIG